MTEILIFAFGLIFSVVLGFGFGVLTGLAITWRAPRDQRRPDEKGMSLLRSWLSPEQAKLWDSHRHFEVVGSDTGTRYRIRYGTAMNVEELDSGGKTIVQWCFIPEGDLVVGDVLLAQKVALETMEREALAAANRQVHLLAGSVRSRDLPCQVAPAAARR
jgi:hypothetical protein